MEMTVQELFTYTLYIIVLLAAAVAVHVAIPTVPLPAAALLVLTPGLNVITVIAALYMAFVAHRK
tara:strand:- start:635 stop:829 length:195 start_codon:yes stop_codon:yes gene_type:complete